MLKTLAYRLNKNLFASLLKTLRHGSLSVLSIYLIVGCAGGSYEEMEQLEAGQQQGEQGQEGEYDADQAGGFDAYSAADELMDIADTADTAGDAPQLSRRVPMASAALNKLTPKNRKIHYDGKVKVQVRDPRKTLKQVIEWVVAAGGYVEKQTLDSATLKIPVGKFFDIYNRTLKLGTLLGKSLTARDLTDSIGDLKLRKSLMESSLQKLQSMLSRARSAAERLTLLAEIKRLRESLAVMSTNLAQLQKLAAYSQLHFKAVPEKTAFASLVTQKSFAWIGNLSPHSKSLAMSNEPFEWSYPKGFVKIPKIDAFIVESSSKVQIRSTVLENNPKGSTRFWFRAVLHTMQKDKRKTVKVFKLNKFEALQILDKGDPDTHYLVALNARGNEIRLIEAVYPSEQEMKRFHKSITRSIGAIAKLP